MLGLSGCGSRRGYGATPNPRVDRRDEISIGSDRERAGGDLVAAGAHGALPMMPIEFRSTVVLKADGKVFVVLFDGEPMPGALAILRCTPEAARALVKNLRSAVKDE